MASQLHEIFSARSIAIIGASGNPQKRGYQVVAKLLNDGYEGRIFPINPTMQELLGLKVYPSLQEVKEPVQLALACTPADTIPGIVEQCGRKGIKGVVVIAGGFSEAGEGIDLAQRTLEMAHRYGVRIIGPNTNGVFNLYNRMNLVGVPDVVPGHIGIVSQSGNMTLAFIAEAKDRMSTGFSTYVGVGNQMDVRFNEYLEYFGNDDHTRVPVFYIEGFKNGRRFLEVCREVARKKPVVVYKSGRSEAGQAMAKSHTGSLASSFAMTKDLLRQAGATVVEQSDKVLSTAEGLSTLPLVKGNRVAILADGGGHATVTVDAAIDREILPSQFSADTLARLAKLLPEEASHDNPVDVAGATDRNPGAFADCAEILLTDSNVDMLMLVGMFGGYSLRYSASLLSAEIETSQRICELARRYRKPVIVQSIYALQMPEPLRVLKDGGVPLFIWAENAVRCASELIDYSRARERIISSPIPARRPAMPQGRAIIESVRAQGRSSLFEHEARSLLGAYGIDVPTHFVARSARDIEDATAQFGDTPVAMKIISEDILHKSDAGGVLLEISGAEALRHGFVQLLGNARAYRSDARIEGVLIAPMAQLGVEVILGVIHDETFGPVMMFGLGGIFVEVLKDVTFRSLPMSRADAVEMVGEIRSRKILEGVRGAPPVDRDALVDLIMNVAHLALSHPEICEIDLNPVIARQKGCDVVDARMILTAE